MGNQRNVYAFTKRLFQLFCTRGIPLSESLRIIGDSCGKTKNSVSLAGGYIRRELEKGNKFANALRTCPYIKFDDVYISFAELAHKSGNLSETMEFLEKRCERQNECEQKIIQVLVYPVFVIFLSILISAGLWTYGKSVIGEEKFNMELKMNILKAFMFLTTFCASLFLYFRKTLSKNRLYEGFCAVSFLLRSGVNSSAAIGFGMNIVGLESPEGKFFLFLRKKIEEGVDFFKAFGSCCKNRNLMKKEISEIFYYAQKSGTESHAFEEASLWLKEDMEKRQKLLISMVEPVFITGVGIFLLILMVSFLLPLMNGLDFM